MNLHWLVALREVADTGSYTVAAHRLFISQPEVSQQVRQLEAYFGTKLIRRNVHHLQLTEAGHEVYDLARRALLDYDYTRERVQDVANGRHGVITLVSSSSAFHPLLTPAMKRLEQEHPDVGYRTIMREGP